jgi:hypothetical protein
MPNIGDIILGKQLGKSPYHAYIWADCIDCGKERWSREFQNKPLFPRCHKCAMTLRIKANDLKKHNNSKNAKTYRARHPGVHNKLVKKYRDACRYESIKHYSNGTMSCACCGENHYEFLAIDHINGGGDSMRKELGHGNIGRVLKARGFPLGYRILCHNCNMAIGFYGYCPHQKLTTDLNKAQAQLAADMKVRG